MLTDSTATMSNSNMEVTELTVESLMECIEEAQDMKGQAYRVEPHIDIFPPAQYLGERIEGIYSGECIAVLNEHNTLVWEPTGKFTTTRTVLKNEIEEPCQPN